MNKLTTLSGIAFPTHRLENGLVVVITSGHGFSFSDGTRFEGITEDFPREFLQTLKVDRELKVIQEVPFRATESNLKLSEEVLSTLRDLSEKADIVLVPIMVLDAMKKMGIRSEFPRVVGQNSTPESSRADARDKVVDTKNFAW